LPAVSAVALVANVTGLPLSPVTEAWSWYAVPAVVQMVQLPTVATPCALVVGVSPETEPPFTAANVTLMPGTGFPLASVTRTAGAGDTVPPATVVAGIVTLAAMAEAGPVATLNEEQVAEVSPAADAPRRYPLPERLISRLANVATPPTALAVAVPESVPPPGLVEI